MSITTHDLLDAINAFVVIVNQCLSETVFDEDRYLYLADLAVARSWLARVSAGESPITVAAEILAPAVARQFTSDWRQGAWGNQELNAFNALIGEVRRKLS